MFDSSRKMNSYVVTEIGTGLGPSITIGSDDFVFVKVPYGQASSFATTVVFMGAPLTIPPTAPAFYGQDFTLTNNNGISNTTWTSPTPVILDYFVVRHSSQISSTDDYGLVVYNEDQTVQFDSRSITLGQHFKINSFYETRTVDAWSPQNGGEELGSSGDYVELSKWTNGVVGGLITSSTVIGLWIGPRHAINYFSTAIDLGNSGDDDDSPLGPPGGNGLPTSGGNFATSTESYNNSINAMIVTGVLI
jgi:hypothetical protein